MDEFQVRHTRTNNGGMKAMEMIESKAHIPCFECNAKAEHDHHVIPRCRGGSKTVPLCLRCHGLAHETRMRLSVLVKEGQAKLKVKPRPRDKHEKDAYQLGAQHLAKWARPQVRVLKLRFEGRSVAEIAKQVVLNRKTVRRLLNKAGMP